MANVEVHVDGGRCLDVRDPSSPGACEKGDGVPLQSRQATICHIIQDIIPSTPTTPTRVHIAAALDQTRDREQTQVIFLKRQEYRTDLFGVGAIAFDLISCGKSSERFYESIRRFEFDGNVRGSVEATIGKYRRVKDGLADEPELVHIFEPFRQGSDYAPETCVELILRCMLKADKTPCAVPRPGAHLRENNGTPLRMPEAQSRTRSPTRPRTDYKNNPRADNPLIT